MDGEMTRQEIQDALNLVDKVNFRQIYLLPAIEYGFVEMKFSQSPNHPQQKYRLTAEGKDYKACNLK
jgi:hypothetical protein